MNLQETTHDPGDGFARRLRHAMATRNRRKATALAAEIGVAESSVSRWRRGGPITIPHAIRLCEALSVSMDWLLRGEGDIDESRARPAADHCALSADAAREVAAYLQRYFD